MINGKTGSVPLNISAVYLNCLEGAPFNMHSYPGPESALAFLKCRLGPCSCPLLYPPQTLFVVGYTVFTLSVRACVCVCVRASVCASVRPSVTFCFLNILKSHCWIFIKPCKHVHICKTNTLDKKVRARGQY